MELLNKLETTINQIIENYELKLLEIEEYKEKIVTLEQENQQLISEKTNHNNKVESLLTTLQQVDIEQNLDEQFSNTESTS